MTDQDEVFDGITVDLLRTFVATSAMSGFDAAMAELRTGSVLVDDGDLDPPELPAASSGPERYLSIAGFAERAGLAVNTVKGYRSRGALPEPDALVGKAEGWLPETADRWITNRAGQGTRTDLERPTK